MEAAQEHLSLLQCRGAVGRLNGKLPAHVSYSNLLQDIGLVLQESPSSFNSQSTRLVILLGSDHSRHWRAVMDDTVSEAERQHIEHCLLPAAGTILFFEDTETVTDLQCRMPLFAERFMTWAMQGTAMVMDLLWTLLASQGLAAMRCHYGLPGEQKNSTHAPLYPASRIPPTWLPTAELVFGSFEAPAMPVVKVPDATRFKVLCPEKEGAWGPHNC